LAARSSFLDVFPSAGADLLEGNLGRLLDVVDTAPVVRCPFASDETCMLRASASDLLQAAAGKLRNATREPPQQLRDRGSPDRFGVRTAVDQLCTQRVGQALHRGAMDEGVFVTSHSGASVRGWRGLLPTGLRSAATCTVTL
jgi:hypothetical protein